MSIEIEETVAPTIVSVPKITPAFHIGMMPVYWGNSVDSMKLIEEGGVKIYYLIGIQPFETFSGANNTGTKTTTYQTEIFRVESSFLGRSIVLCQSDELGLAAKVKPGAVFSLPKIPYTLFKKMDSFFRAMFAKHGTEATLILTYDESYISTQNPGDGWGCFSPTQENTSHKCDYDMDVVMEQKPEGVSLAGTIHSHPNMSAYASHTDEKDQSDFTGVHITFGWAPGSAHTETHQEMVAGGKTWTLHPETLYEGPPLPAVDADTEIEEWGKTVSKKVHTPPTQTTNSFTTGSTLFPRNTLGVSHNSSAGNRVGGHLGAVRASGVVPTKLRTVKTVPGMPDPRHNVIIVQTTRLDAGAKCPFCDVPMSMSAWNNHRCIGCQSYIIDPAMTIKDICEIRSTRNQPYIEAIDTSKATKPIVLWIPKGTNGSTEDVFSGDMRDESLIGADPKV